VTLALADIDGNGTLDLYVANNRTDDIRDRGQVDLRMVNGRLTVPPALRDRLVMQDGRLQEYGQPDVLYVNDGHGHFTPVSWTSGTFRDEAGQPLPGPPLDWGLTAAFHDLNGDGAPDLYVCNDYWTPDRIWINDGKGGFRALDPLALRCTSASSMGVDFADVNRSGNVDFIVLDMLSRDLRLRKRQVLAQIPMASPPGMIDDRPQVMRNTLFKSRGDGTYEEIANFAGVAASEWSWSPLFVDVDLDGYEDLLISAGHIRDVQDMDAMAASASRAPRPVPPGDAEARRQAFIDLKMENSRLYPSLDMPIIAFRNRGGYRFEETTRLWGTDRPGVHHAMAMADLDGDGDLDLVVNNLGSAMQVFRNDTAAARVAVRLKGLPPNTQGVGATITLRGGAVSEQRQEVICGGRYMAGSDPLRVFAAGQGADPLRIEVVWRSGKRSEVTGVKPNWLVEVDEAGAGPVPTGAATNASRRLPLFRDISDFLGHEHRQEDFRDFDQQPLLPRRLSRGGPGVAWADVDGDGWEDLVIGSGRGGTLGVYRNDGQGGFKPWYGMPFEAPVTRDQTGVLEWPSPEGGTLILTAFADCEPSSPMGPGIRQYDLAHKSVEEPFEPFDSATGTLAAADLTGTGTLSLFVGGRCVAGRYPEPASSRILRREGTRWVLDAGNSRVLQKVGLIRGAVWSDLDGDGLPELILACEWGPIRVFQNTRGSLHEITAELGLDRYVGWWTGVTTGDLDGDGRPDIVAANWGLNSSYRATPARPTQLFYGNLAGRGGVNLIEAEHDPATDAVVPRRGLEALAQELPELPGRFPTHRAYSEATVEAVLGPAYREARRLEAGWLASTVFLNRGCRMDPVPLPDEAQLAPAFGVCVADFDGDGFEDVLVSQNFFGNTPEIPRQDAGRGLLLRGDGTGALHPVPGQDSGIRVYGEQRGAAVADFDHDGRPDVVLTQNGAASKLYRNLGAKPGLRVRVVGDTGNPHAIGAALRWTAGDSRGPLREIHGGSGYASQDAATQILAVPRPDAKLQIRWPGGRITEHPIPDGQEVTIRAQKLSNDPR
jgi:hypothetical protein